jgi:acyl-coenzyme A synthetase/AMP-(fatty) acid ligase
MPAGRPRAAQQRVKSAIALCTPRAVAFVSGPPRAETGKPRRLRLRQTEKENTAR